MITIIRILGRLGPGSVWGVTAASKDAASPVDIYSCITYKYNSYYSLSLLLPFI